MHLERESRARTRSGRGRRRATASRRSARGSGTATTTRADGEKTEFHPFRAAWVVRASARASPTSAARRGRGRPLHLDRRDARRAQQAECAHRDEGQRPVQVVLARRRDWLSVNGSYRLHALRARRRVRPARGSSRALVDRAASTRRRSRSSPAGRLRRRPLRRSTRPDGSAGRRREADLRRLVDGRRRSTTCACTSTGCSFVVRWTRLRARPADVQGGGRVHSARPDHDRARRVAAALERRRDLGALAGDARGEGRLDVRRHASASTSTSSRASRGRSSRSLGLRLRCAARSSTAPAIRWCRARARARSATRAATTIRARSRVTLPDAGARPPRRERRDRRLDLPGRRTPHGCYQLTYTVSRVR